MKFKPFLLLFALMVGCSSVPVAKLPGGAEFVLSGPLEDAFAAITMHDAKAITLSEEITIYGRGGPPSAQLKCHEDHHKKQARLIADKLVEINAITDSPRGRMIAWLAVYGQEYLQSGYDNRFEREARAACPPVVEVAPTTGVGAAASGPEARLLTRPRRIGHSQHQRHPARGFRGERTLTVASDTASNKGFPLPQGAIRYAHDRSRSHFSLARHPF